MNNSTRVTRRPRRALLSIRANRGRHHRHGRLSLAGGSARRQPINHRFRPLVEGGHDLTYSHEHLRGVGWRRRGNRGQPPDEVVGVSGIFWRAAGLGALVLVLLLVVGTAAASAHRTAGCGSNRIGVRGPTANRSDIFFNETVFGCATGRANYVISGEQLAPAGGCASTYRAEATRSDFQQSGATGPGQRVRARFSLVAHFYSRQPGTHGICSYLVNRTTKQTYAHAGRFWTNS
jgi:hypothetical protein